MRISELSPELIAQISARRYDFIVEKHEGPWQWASVLEYEEPEFLQIGTHWVLLPIGHEHHPNIAILRVIESADGNSLTIFLKDTTFVEQPAREFFDAGFLAFCDKIPGANFFLCVVYHEWFLIHTGT
jgi:hypothetical protein